MKTAQEEGKRGRQGWTGREVGMLGREVWKGERERRTEGRVVKEDG